MIETYKERQQNAEKQRQARQRYLARCKAVQELERQVGCWVVVWKCLLQAVGAGRWQCSVGGSTREALDSVPAALTSCHPAALPLRCRRCTSGSSIRRTWLPPAAWKQRQRRLRQGRMQQGQSTQQHPSCACSPALTC